MVADVACGISRSHPYQWRRIGECLKHSATSGNPSDTAESADGE